MTLEMAQNIAENKMLHSDKMNLMYVVQELVKHLKKKKEAKLSHAINMLNKE